MIPSPIASLFASALLNPSPRPPWLVYALALEQGRRDVVNPKWRAWARLAPL